MNTVLKSCGLFAAIALTFQSCKPPSDVEEPCKYFTVAIAEQGNNELKAQTDGGQLPITFQWSNGVTLSNNTVNSSGIYTVTATDGIGCTTTATINYTYVPACSPATVTDAEGNVYDVVTIGTQCWMKQNLRVSAGIAEVSDSMAWMTATGAGTAAWCWPQNSAVNSGYGKLYNWYAIQNANLCPPGWHVPTAADWTTLINYLGGESVAGGKLKSDGTLFWDTPNGGATNSSGFTAVGAGDRSTQSLFESFRLVGIYWSATATPATATVFLMNSSAPTILNANHSKQSAYSIRCVRD